MGNLTHLLDHAPQVGNLIFEKVKPPPLPGRGMVGHNIIGALSLNDN